MSEMKIYWGDLHDNVNMHDHHDVSEEQSMRIARSHLDFYGPAYYTAQSASFSATVEGQPVVIGAETWKKPEKIKKQWDRIEELTKQFNEPGRFVTFPAYEWQGDGVSGDHNVVFKNEGGKVYAVNTLTELYGELRGQEAIAIPHHIAYRLGARGKDWEVQDDTLSPFAEIYSVHLSSETDEEICGLRRNTKMGPCAGGQSWQDGLNRGYHIGAICSPDGDGRFPGIYNWGLAAVIAPELTRDAIWDAFQKRHVYGVTGDRIKLDFAVNGALMGDIIQADGSRKIEVAVVGVDEIDRVELLRNGRVIHTAAHQGAWDVPTGRTRFKCRIEAGWGLFEREAGPIPSRRWQGKLTLSDGAEFTGAQPCWTSGEQEMPTLSGSTAQFTIDAPQVDPGMLNVMPHQNAFVFEFDACATDELTVEMDGLTATMPVADLCQHSRILADTETATKTLADIYGIDVAVDERPRKSELFAQRVKIHRAVPEAGYTCAFQLEDDVPLQGESNYRIRVEQRNGQKAWSSPIWVQSK